MIIEAKPEVKLSVRAYSREQDPLQRGIIYARDIRAVMATEEGLTHVIRAANNTLGTVAGGLVVQRSLDLLKLDFPALNRISTDFSGENVALNETVSTRLVSVPEVKTYSPTLGYVSSDAVTTDVPVTIDAHQFAQVEFNANEIASTRRLLFGEQEAPMHYALGLDLMKSIYGLFTEESFPGSTREALVDFDRKSVIQLGADMQSDGRNANTGVRTLLLVPAFYGKLSEDITVVAPLYRGQDAGQAIATGILPPVHGFLPVEVPDGDLPAGLAGFGMRADAVALAVRPANDYASAQAGLPATGVVEQITNPDTGLTVTLVRFVNHLSGTSFMRIAWMRGAAKGNPNAGQRLVSE